MTSPVVPNALPALGHSINPTSSSAPAKMFAPSSALASFAARMASPMSSGAGVDSLAGGTSGTRAGTSSRASAVDGASSSFARSSARTTTEEVDRARAAALACEARVCARVDGTDGVLCVDAI
eukprot:CAMPEP_0179719402 /NCGR_PEP_ID=MMETSP0938-20121108/3408_1 /TAXON_ID=548131 ORGANISM="Ostreococcus mediterraneus, Strain clade-D-RCC1107" /NCGR_SAMPLE_ID=MMETSP0938 /ASSEMBLY_ACC=CAM_ASM_000576 /LENGTH=122 /DNA_ID=CAMNT_0021593239 /DNA_START=120 /DNA_END=485 /DNA_ORIENTATION=+